MKHRGTKWGDSTTFRCTIGQIVWLNTDGSSGGTDQALSRVRSFSIVSHLVAVERSEHVVTALERAATGASRSDLSRSLLAADPTASREEREEADAFVDSLIDRQIL